MSVNKGMSNEDKIDKVCTDVAILAAQVGEMSKRLDEQSKSIGTLNHNSTDVKVAVARLEGHAERNRMLIEGNKDYMDSMKDDFSANLKTWLTVFGVLITIVTFVINYFKV